MNKMTTERRLIDINKFPLLPSRLDGDMSEYERGYLDAQKNMNLLPTVYAVEVVHGHWIRHYDDLFPAESTQECSECHEHEDMLLCNENYCPNCGAKMDGDGNEN